VSLAVFLCASQAPEWMVLNLVLNLVMPCYDAVIDRGGAMNVIQNIQPISFLKTNTSDVVKQVQETREPVLITVNGKVQAVIQDPMSYQKMQDQLTVLRILAHGQKQIEHGKVIDHEDLFAQFETQDRES
jgi:prevent-host-death family protein